MNVPAFLDELRALDIAIRVDGDQLRCSAPAGALTGRMLEQLRQKKGEILNFLCEATALAAQQRAIVPLHAGGERVPVFAVAGHNGDVFSYRALVGHLGGDRPFFGLQPPGLDGQSDPLASVEELASYFSAQILAFRPQGACVIAGYCAGGTIAFELARQLVARGKTVSFVALFGCPDPAWYRSFPQFCQRLSAQAMRLGKHLRALKQLPFREYSLYFDEKLSQRRARRLARELAERQPDPALAARERVEVLTLSAVRRYSPGYFAGHIHMILPSPAWGRSGEGWLRWRSRLAQRFSEFCGPDGCTGDNMLREPYAPVIADLFRCCCEQSDTPCRLQVSIGQAQSRGRLVPGSIP